MSPDLSSLEEPTDVLAAEVFPVGTAASDADAVAEAPHDVLAAEEFPVVGPEPFDQRQASGSEPSHGYGAGAEPIDISPAQWISAAVVALGLIGLVVRRARRR